MFLFWWTDFFCRSYSFLNGTLRQKPTLVINFRFPWGLLLLYFEIPQYLVPFMNNNSSNGSTTSSETSSSDITLPSMDKFSSAQRVLAQWLMGNDEYKNQRLKLIPYVGEGPWVVRNLVTGKPAIIGTKLPVTHTYFPGEENNVDVDDGSSKQQQQPQPYILTELDIGSGSRTAKRIVSICKRYMNTLTVDIGFVIQGNDEQELPEQMLGAIRIHGVDPNKAPQL